MVILIVIVFYKCGKLNIWYLPINEHFAILVHAGVFIADHKQTVELSRFLDLVLADS